ncbi:hypothetical protein HK101_006837 [Irineochytrium annulatum]|nr:hypothetical protein HK101_006837 [Irineochytrium annulatum]
MKKRSRTSTAPKVASLKPAAPGSTAPPGIDGAFMIPDQLAAVVCVLMVPLLVSATMSLLSPVLGDTAPIPILVLFLALPPLTYRGVLPRLLVSGMNIAAPLWCVLSPPICLSLVRAAVEYGIFRRWVAALATIVAIGVPVAAMAGVAKRMLGSYINLWTEIGACTGMVAGLGAMAWGQSFEEMWANAMEYWGWLGYPLVDAAGYARDFWMYCGLWPTDVMMLCGVVLGGVEASSPTAHAKKSKITRVVILALAAMAAMLVRSDVPQARRVVSNQDGRRFLFRNYSRTGYISVIEDPNLNTGVRLLRCDHSIIGGVFTTGEYAGSSVYSSLYIPTFVKDVIRSRNETKRPPSTLSRANVTVHAVELDGAVASCARQHFGLPESVQVHVGDGREVLNNARNGVYDFIIHDVFTNGALPATLFSVEAVRHMKRVMVTNGVLAMNYVGSLKHPTSTYLHATLRFVFVHVNVLFDSEKEPAATKVANIVFFCSDMPITFRPPAEMISGDPARDDVAKRLASMIVDFEKEKEERWKERLLRDSDWAKVVGEVPEDHYAVMLNEFGLDFWMAI